MHQDDEREREGQREREREMGEDAEERGEIVLGIWLAVKRRRGKSLIRNGILHFEGEREEEAEQRCRDVGWGHSDVTSASATDWAWGSRNAPHFFAGKQRGEGVNKCGRQICNPHYSSRGPGPA